MNMHGASATPDEAFVKLRGFGVAFGDRVVLAEVTMELPRRGFTTLVGPSGSGKSTLLRTLAGLNDMHPELSTWGTATIGGSGLEATRPLAPGELRPGIGFVVQHARFFMNTVRENLVASLPNRGAIDRATQTALVTGVLARYGLAELVPLLEVNVASLAKPTQRRLAIVRALVADPPILFADEPTTGLEEADSVDILALLRVQASHRSILLVTHNQRFARVLGGTVVLMAGGRIHEMTAADAFFRAPRTDLGRSFVLTGGCAEPSPNARPEDLDHEVAPPPPLPAVAATRSRSSGPRGFFWVRPDRLGGLPRPGIVDSVEHDIEGLKRLGVTTLVTLEETATVDRSLLTNAGIEPEHFPVIDMDVPTLESAARLCGRIRARLASGGVVALHCRAGLGRTGTLLACQLVFDGEPALGAIERIRRLNPKCIQSQAQVEFLSSFESFLRARGVTVALPTSENARSQEKENQA
jgi:atypical dual specificity phosphatase